MELEQRRYPIGKYAASSEVTTADIARCIETIAEFPAKLRAVVQPLPDVKLESRYRENGWTIRQIVHHVVDSHLSSYVRFKWALTEDNPTIKTYHQELWAERPDAKAGPVEMSLKLLEGLHERWVYVLRTMTEEEWSRTFYHPEMQKTPDLKWLVTLYDWHCRHHLAHIELAINAPDTTV